jgi:hypothetical protein
MLKSFEAGVNTVTKDTDGRDWLQLTWYEPTGEAETGAPQPSEHCSIYMLASSLPGVKYGDKVQVTLESK